MLLVVALGSRLTLDFPFIDIFGVLQEHILSQFSFFWGVFPEPYLREDPAIDCMDSPLAREFRSHLSSKHFSVDFCSDEVHIVNKLSPS